MRAWWQQHVLPVGGDQELGEAQVFLGQVVALLVLDAVHLQARLLEVLGGRAEADEVHPARGVELSWSLVEKANGFSTVSKSCRRKNTVPYLH